MNMVRQKYKKKNNASKVRCESKINAKTAKKYQIQTATQWEKATNCKY